MNPKYAPVKEFEGIYTACSAGFIINLKTGRILRGYQQGEYLGVTLSSEGKQVTKGLHVAILEAFKAKPSPLHECNHIDLNKQNCGLDNLEWLTSSENSKHAASNMKGNVKLTSERKAWLVSESQKGKSYADLHRELGMSYAGVRTAIITATKEKAT